MLGLLHRLKLIWHTPAVVNPEPRCDNSPKLNWLLKILAELKHTTKDIGSLFLRSFEIYSANFNTHDQKFGFRPVIINGDTSTKSQSQKRRQRLIDDFQAQPGF